MAVGIIDTQLNALPIIAKHLKAMDDELQKQRNATSYDWNDGMFADVPEVIVRTSGDGIALGKFVTSDVGGYEFTQDDAE